MTTVPDNVRRWWPIPVLAGVVAVAVFLLTVHQRDSGPDTANPPSVSRVGPAQGELVVDYVRQAEERLTSLPADVSSFALVQLREYLAPDALPGLLPSAGVKVSRVIVRLPLSDVQTEVITGSTRGAPSHLAADATRAMDNAVARKVDEAAEAEDAAAHLRGSADSERSMREFYRQTADIARQEADGFRAGCACVFALVVQAKPAVLRGLTTVAQIRVVDPALEVSNLEQAAFTPLLPEQTETVKPLPDPSLPELSGS